MPNCLIYCRVSTEEQADKGYSLDAQEKLCRDFAERNGYRVIGVHRDEGKSGTSLDRPALTELLSTCTPDRSIDAVIVQETDRLARNTKDHLTVKAVLKKASVKLISVAQPMLDDSPEGMMIDTILASVNQFQSDINSRKTKRGLREKFDQGWWPGWAPIGYLNVEVSGGEDYGKRRCIVRKDPERWELVRYGLHLYLSGHYSADEVGDILYEKGLRSKNGKKIPHSGMVATLRNPFYAGIMRWNGLERMGRHDPMITRTEHEQILDILSSHNLNACRRRKHTFLLRGFICCNTCGRRYTAEVHSAKKKSYYGCSARGAHSNRGQNIEVSYLERMVARQFKKVQFTGEFAEQTLYKLRRNYHQQKEETNSRLQVFYNRKKAVESKLEKAEEKLLDGVLSDDAFTRLRARFSEELSAINDEIWELNDQQKLDMDVIQRVLRLSRNIYQEYQAAPYELKRHYLSIFWEKFLVQDRAIVEAVPTKIVKDLLELKHVRITTNWLPSSPLIRTLTNQEYMTSLKYKLNLLPAMSGNRTV